MSPSSTRPAVPPTADRMAALAAYAATPFASLDEAINQTLALLADLTGISLTMIHRLEGDTLVVSHACDRMGLGIETPVTVRRADTFCDTVLESLAPLIVPDADADPHWRQLPGKLLVGTRSYISVPIVLGDGRVFGTLCAHDRRVLDLGQPEIDAMRIMARMIASQIERDEALRRESETARDLAVQNQELTSALPPTRRTARGRGIDLLRARSGSAAGARRRQCRLPARRLRRGDQPGRGRSRTRHVAWSLPTISTRKGWRRAASRRAPDSWVRSSPAAAP